MPWAEIVALYRVLVARHPTVGAITGMAVALAHTDAGLTSHPRRRRYLPARLRGLAG